MISTYGFKMFILGVFQLISVAANFCKPLILSQLLSYMESDRTDPSEGFTWAGMMISVSLIEGLISVHLDYQLQRVKLSMRSVLVTVRNTRFALFELTNQETNSYIMFNLLLLVF